MVFDELVAGVVNDGELRSCIAKLTGLKRSAAELDSGARIPAIHAFLEREITRLGEVAMKMPKHPVSAELQKKMDQYFRNVLEQ